MTSEKEHKKKAGIKFGELEFGELYITLKKHTFSNWDYGYKHIQIPSGEMLLFRSFQPYSKDNSNLALFHWIKHKINVCLVVNDKTPWLYMKHVDWESRHKVEKEFSQKEIE